MALRLTACLAGLLTAFGASLAGSSILLSAKGSLIFLDRYYLYSWLCGAVAAVFALLFCGRKYRFSTPKWALLIAVVSLMLPLLRLLDTPTPAGRVLRYFVFFTHVPLTAVLGLIVAMMLFRSMKDAYEN